MLECGKESLKVFVALLLALGVPPIGAYAGVLLRDYYRRGPNWCDWCGKAVDSVSAYDGLKLCRNHYTKATIVGRNGRYDSV